VLDQVRYSLLDRHVQEEGLLETAAETGMGIICFSPLAQGLLTDKYLDGRIPEGARPTHSRFLPADRIDAAMVAKLNKLASVAQRRGQSLAQMAISWLLRDTRVTSVLVGASSLSQLDQNLGILDGTFDFDSSELREIDAILATA
jgi:L-glyceraldehyde 3-phosphate reductase